MTTRTRTTEAYLDALIHGTMEKWTQNTWLNPQTKWVLKHGRKRFDADSRKRITEKELTERNFVKA
jgi:hypothetical protein